jgi:RimJ/RimL family protein N-acetyltransferase
MIYQDKESIIKEKYMLHKEWKELIAYIESHPEAVRICRNQEEVDRAIGDQVAYLGLEDLSQGAISQENISQEESFRENPSQEAPRHLENCPYIYDTSYELETGDLLRVYARFHGIPMEILETKRTLVRELSLEDTPELFQIYQEDHMTDYMEDLYPYEEEMTYEENYIRNVYGLYDYGIWIIRDKETNELIGRAGVESKPDLPLDTVELGYAIAPHLWHQGYATEVCSAILDYSRDVLEKSCVIAEVDPMNQWSIAMLLRLGFQNVSENKRENGLLTYRKPLI